MHNFGNHFFLINRLLSNEEWFLASFYIPSKLTNLTPDIADRIYAAYRSDLAIRMSLMMRLLDGKPVGVSKMKSQVDFSTSLNVTDPDLYPSIYRIICILLTMPVSSATSERSFSAMQCVKSYLRSTMGDERLSNLSLLHVHRHLNVDVDTAINDFISRKSRRLDF